MLEYPFDLNKEKAAILAEGSFGALESKFAAAMLRYRPDRVVCVIDSMNVGRTAQEAIGVGGSVPVVASLEEAFQFRPTLLAIGIAPPGGESAGELALRCLVGAASWASYDERAASALSLGP